MSYSHTQHIRLLQKDDIGAIERLLRTSEYIYQRFTLTELPLLLLRYPAVGIFHKGTLYGFLVSQITNAPGAWISGFGVSWSESKNYPDLFATLFEHLRESLLRRGVFCLQYSGNDTENDWLRSLLLKQKFLPYRELYSYDKYDFFVPTEGNQRVIVRSPRLLNPQSSSGQTSGDDAAALLAIEQACFEELWRYDHVAFFDIVNTHPYFRVAELDGRIVGYQFNACDNDAGYLIRIAVHPDASGQQIGARLMAEAVHYFQRERVDRIMLNTQDDNYRAHDLYEWFGFIRMPQMGFVLRKQL